MYFPDNALKFDGVQNYLNLGTLGNMGSNIGNGFFISFDIKSTQTTKSSFGLGAAGQQIVKITFNGSANELSTVSGNIGVVIRNRLTTKLLRAATNTPSIIFNNGSKHTISIQVLPASNSVSISIDGVSQNISYAEQQTPTEFENFSTKPFVLGALYYNTGLLDYMSCTLDNVKIGTNSGSLYGNYLFDEGTGITTDNTLGTDATLVGTVKPLWVKGLNFTSPLPSFFRQ